MPRLSQPILERKKAQLKSLDQDFMANRSHFQDVAKFLLPRKYIWLQSLPRGRDARKHLQNENIFDGTGTRAVRKLAAGMMGGLTSVSYTHLTLPTTPYV